MHVTNPQEVANTPALKPKVFTLRLPGAKHSQIVEHVADLRDKRPHLSINKWLMLAVENQIRNDLLDPETPKQDIGVTVADDHVLPIHENF